MRETKPHLSRVNPDPKCEKKQSWNPRRANQAKLKGKLRTSEAALGGTNTRRQLLYQWRAAVRGWTRGFQSPRAHSGFQLEEKAGAGAGHLVGPGAVADRKPWAWGHHQSPLTLHWRHAEPQWPWSQLGALGSKSHWAERQQSWFTLIHKCWLQRMPNTLPTHTNTHLPLSLVCLCPSLLWAGSGKEVTSLNDVRYYSTCLLKTTEILWMNLISKGFSLCHYEIWAIYKTLSSTFLPIHT